MLICDEGVEAGKEVGAGDGVTVGFGRFTCDQYCTGSPEALETRLRMAASAEYVVPAIARTKAMITAGRAILRNGMALSL